jgi:hypothetical protein
MTFELGNPTNSKDENQTKIRKATDLTRNSEFCLDAVFQEHRNESSTPGTKQAFEKMIFRSEKAFNVP